MTHSILLFPSALLALSEVLGGAVGSSCVLCEVVLFALDKAVCCEAIGIQSRGILAFDIAAHCERSP